MTATLQERLLAWATDPALSSVAKANIIEAADAIGLAVTRAEKAETECERLRDAARVFSETVMVAVHEHLGNLEVAGTLAEEIVKAHQTWLDSGIESVGHENDAPREGR